MPEVQINQILQDEEGDLWPRRDSEVRVLHGAAFPDPEQNGMYVVRYVGINEADARQFAALRGGVYVRATQVWEVERSDWEAQP